jgi:hypothetical protein
MTTKNATKKKTKATKAKAPTTAKTAKATRDEEVAKAHALIVSLAEAIGSVEVAYRDAPEEADGPLENCSSDLLSHLIEAAYDWAYLTQN